MKYIMIQVNQNGHVREFPVIFPDFIVHAHMADAMTRMMRREYRAPESRPVSAGFTSSMNVAKPGSLHGESESLRLHSRPEDGQHTMGLDYNHGIVL